MYEMKPEYFTGITLIDEEHKQLFAYANEAYDLLQEEFIPDKYDRIVAILQELRNYTKKHFSDEEAYMESIQYKRIFTQKIQHQEFIDKLDNIDIDSIEAGENQDEAIIDILEFLTNWLIHHILELDTLIGK
ncbi:MAG: hemerythrin family protein [Lachnospiraceae bacterium]|nr:hemerythrin family protein [Lachnospiraceae bacterium]